MHGQPGGPRRSLGTRGEGHTAASSYQNTGRDGRGCSRGLYTHPCTHARMEGRLGFGIVLFGGNISDSKLFPSRAHRSPILSATPQAQASAGGLCSHSVLSLTRGGFSQPPPRARTLGSSPQVHGDSCSDKGPSACCSPPRAGRSPAPVPSTTVGPSQPHSLSRLGCKYPEPSTGVWRAVLSACHLGFIDDPRRSHRLTGLQEAVGKAAGTRWGAVVSSGPGDLTCRANPTLQEALLPPSTAAGKAELGITLRATGLQCWLLGS